MNRPSPGSRPRQIDDLYVGHNLAPASHEAIARFVTDIVLGNMGPQDAVGMPRFRLGYLVTARRATHGSATVRPRDVRDYYRELVQAVAPPAPDPDTEPGPITVNSDEGLAWRRAGKYRFLVVRVALDEALRDRREEIKGRLEERFGPLPPLAEFDPHVTLAKVKVDAAQHSISTDNLPGSFDLASGPKSLELYIYRISGSEPPHQGS